VTDKWKMQFSDDDVETIKIVLQYIIAQNERVIDGDRNRSSSAVDVTAHRVCLMDCKCLLDYVTGVTG